MRLPLRRQAFTLVELMITVAIVSFAGTSIILSIMFGIYLKQSIRERNGAARVAGTALEETKKKLLQRLSYERRTDIVIDDRGTATTADDVRGTLDLRLFDENGNEVGVAGSPIPLNRSMLMVEATVTWAPAGRRAQRTQQLVMHSLLAP